MARAEESLFFSTTNMDLLDHPDLLKLPDLPDLPDLTELPDISNILNFLPNLYKSEIMGLPWVYDVIFKVGSMAGGKAIL